MECQCRVQVDCLEFKVFSVDEVMEAKYTGLNAVVVGVTGISVRAGEGRMGRKRRTETEGAKGLDEQL